MPSRLVLNSDPNQGGNLGGLLEVMSVAGFQTGRRGEPEAPCGPQGPLEPTSPYRGWKSRMQVSAEGLKRTLPVAPSFLPVTPGPSRSSRPP